MAPPATVHVLHRPSAIVLSAILALRARAWEGFAYTRQASLYDDHEGTALHLVIGNPSGPLAAARLSVHRLPTELPDSAVYPEALASLTFPLVSYNRLVVSPENRGQGFAQTLDTYALDYAFKHLAPLVVCWTRFSARRVALERAGFTRLGECNEPPIPGEQPAVAYMSTDRSSAL